MIIECLRLGCWGKLYVFRHPRNPGLSDLWENWFWFWFWFVSWARFLDVNIVIVIVASSTKSQYKSSFLALQNFENTGYFHLKYSFF